MVSLLYAKRTGWKIRPRPKTFTLKKKKKKKKKKDKIQKIIPVCVSTSGYAMQGSPF